MVLQRSPSIAKESTLNSQIVYVVDDDRDVRRSISFMLATAEISSYPFASGVDFLEGLDELRPGCILLDIRMPQIDGFQVMDEMAARGVNWPVVVMTGHGEVPVAVRAMKLGAVDFIEKPFSEEVLLACFGRAFELLASRKEEAERRRHAQVRVERLTGREAEVLAHLLSGSSNKTIANALGISLRTVEMHRGNMMDRLEVGSLAEALTLAIEAGFEPAGSRAA